MSLEINQTLLDVEEKSDNMKKSKKTLSPWDIVQIRGKQHI